MADLTLDVARKILDVALAKGVELKLKPLVVAVLDARGCIKAMMAQDGTSLLRCEIAHGKAYGALAMGMGSRALYQRAQEASVFCQRDKYPGTGGAGAGAGRRLDPGQQRSAARRGRRQRRYVGQGRNLRRRRHRGGGAEGQRGLSGRCHQPRHCERLSCPPKPALGRRRMRRSKPISLVASGLLRGACHRARIRATRWLAMTDFGICAFSSTPRSADISPATSARRRRLDG